MRSEYSMSCKFCGCRKQFCSNWIYVEVLEAFANFWIFFHCLRHHRSELTFKRIKHSIKAMAISLVVIIAYFLLTLARVITWPLWWVLEKLHDY